MEHLDLKGKTCPLPVIETKTFLECHESVGEIEIVVDNDAAGENVRRFLASKGYATTVAREGDVYRIEGRLEDNEVPTIVPANKRPLVFIDGETIGRGSDELGRVLMRSFLNTIKELEIRPWRMAFINSGVKLVASDSEYIGILNEIQGLGVEIIACGTCLDYFNLKDKIAVGRIGNMFEIVTSFNESTNIIRP
ncbi:MAG: sulfurtransferase-like selenium metabolism protein YedF [Syntrophorhabdus sp.]